MNFVSLTSPKYVNWVVLICVLRFYFYMLAQVTSEDFAARTNGGNGQFWGTICCSKSDEISFQHARGLWVLFNFCPRSVFYHCHSNAHYSVVNTMHLFVLETHVIKPTNFLHRLSGFWLLEDLENCDLNFLMPSFWFLQVVSPQWPRVWLRCCLFCYPSFTDTPWW